MKLSIVTISFNDIEGLKRTVDSVNSQTVRGNIEYIVIDGGSTDGSVEYLRSISNRLDYWISEPDGGIYAGMNKGLEVALGHRVVGASNHSEYKKDIDKVRPNYIQILNAGDILATDDVTERMLSSIENKEDISLLYGNMIKKDYATGKIVGKSKEIEYSLCQYYSSTMNHDCCYIRCDLFDTYGLYDESLKIVSDWKWFLQAIGLGKVQPVYVDIDVTIFDVSGISETNLILRNQERRQVLQELLPPAILQDYDSHAFEIGQINRLQRYRIYCLLHFIERVLFKLEKWSALL